MSGFEILVGGVAVDAHVAVVGVGEQPYHTILFRQDAAMKFKFVAASTCTAQVPL